MKNIAKRSITLLLTVLMLVGIAVPTVSAAEITPQSSAEYTLPVADDKEGYVFKGWRLDNEPTLTVPGTTISRDGVKKILAVYKKARLDLTDIKAQFNEDKTEIRFISVVPKEIVNGDDTMGYTVVFEDTGDTVKMPIKKVYTQLNADYGASVITVDSMGYHENTQGYIATFVIDDLPKYDVVTVSLIPYGSKFSNTHAKITIDIDTFEGTARARSADEYSIMSFNLNATNTGLWGDDDYPSQPKRIQYVVDLTKKYDVDILGVQECAIHWYDSLNDVLVDNGNYAVAGDLNDPDQKWRNAIYYRKDKFDLVEEGTKWLTDTPDVHSNLSEADTNVWGRQYRVMTYVVLRDKITGETLSCSNTHLGFGINDRPKQDDVLLKLSSDLGKKYDCPVFMTGDFNDGGGDGYKGQTGETQQGFFNRYYNSGFSSTTSFIPGIGSSSVDHIFADSKMADVTYHERIAWENGQKMSDHRPLVAKFYLNNN